MNVARATIVSIAIALLAGTAYVANEQAQDAGQAGKVIAEPPIAAPAPAITARNHDRGTDETSATLYPGLILPAFGTLKWNHEPGKYDGKIIWEDDTGFIPSKRVYYNCRDTENGHECDDKIVYKHPYAGYTYDQLASIADFDAVAGFILAERIFDDDTYKSRFEGDSWYQAGVNHFLRSAVLSGRSDPYRRMMAKRGLIVVNSRSLQPEYQQARQIYIWAKAGGDLGYLDADNEPLQNALKHFDEFPLADPDTEFADMDREVEKIKQILIRLKADTTG